MSFTDMVNMVMDRLCFLLWRRESLEQTFEQIFGFKPSSSKSQVVGWEKTLVDKVLAEKAHDLNLAYHSQTQGLLQLSGYKVTESYDSLVKTKEIVGKLAQDCQNVDTYVRVAERKFWQAQNCAQKIGIPVHPKYTDYIKNNS